MVREKGLHEEVCRIFYCSEDWEQKQEAKAEK